MEKTVIEIFTEVTQVGDSRWVAQLWGTFDESDNDMIMSRGFHSEEGAQEALLEWTEEITNYLMSFRKGARK